MFERIGPTVLAGAVSVSITSCASERDHYDFSYDCANADARKAALDTRNTKILTHGNGNSVNDPEARKAQDQETNLDIIRTRGTVSVPSFCNKALNGRIDQAKPGYFYHLRLTKECTFPLDGKQKAWFYLEQAPIKVDHTRTRRSNLRIRRA